MKRSVLSIAVLVVFVFSLVLFIATGMKISKNEEDFNKISNKYYTICENSIKEKQLEGSRIKNARLFYDRDSTLYLKDIVCDDSIFIFWFDQSTCSVCLEMVREMIESYKGGKSIVGLCSFNSKKDFLIHKNNVNYGFPMYHIDYDDVDREPGNINDPFMCIVDSDLNCSRFIIPDYQSKELFKQYLAQIAK